jgi:hypothetical protein
MARLSVAFISRIHRLEAVMGQAVPTQHAAGAPVAIPSNPKVLRALLAFAAIAIVGLTVAVVILANDDDGVTTSKAPASAPAQAEGPRAIHSPGQGYITEGPGYVNPSTGYPSSRLGSGSAKGAQDVAPPPSSIAGSDGSAYSQLRAAGALSTGPVKDYSKNSATGDVGGSSAPSPSTRYDGGPEEGSRGIGR